MAARYNKGVPDLARRLLFVFLRDDLQEEVSGDLEEKFQQSLKINSPLKAKLHYWYQVLQYLRPFAIRKSTSYHLNNLTMFRHYTKIAWRNMLRDKSFFLINSLGLALSMFCAILIILWVTDELSYEDFFPESEKI
jgi:putative ABC transport system permease protein